jgi:hypothetical protein
VQCATPPALGHRGLEAMTVDCEEPTMYGTNQLYDRGRDPGRGEDLRPDEGEQRTQ